MSDIVERLRAPMWKMEPVDFRAHAAEAADEIERLRELMAAPLLNAVADLPDGLDLEAMEEWQARAEAAEKLVGELVAALEGVVRVADRRTIEFDAAHAAITRARQRGESAALPAPPEPGHD